MSPEDAIAPTVSHEHISATVTPAPPAWAAEVDSTVQLDGPEDDDTTPRPDPQPPQGGRIGPYVVLEELARGGMGAVYRARHATLGHEVALKVLLAGTDASESELARFLREARAAARLEHPGVVRIHDVGEHRGLSYLAMDLVRGRSLAARLKDDGPLPGPEAAAATRDVAEALAFAHDQAILHRDLKPGNVLVADDGRVLLTDFGLAKDLESDEEHTRSGQILGTPVYMPPEQARGQHELVDARSDVYSLGATLYALLTGRPPFGGPTLMAVLNAVEKNLPTKPSAIVPGIDPDLETICLKCLEKEPAARYPTARDLADDLTRYLEHRPILARRPTPLERARKWARRNRRVARALTAAGGVSLCVLAGAGVVFVQRLEGEKLRAEQARDDADAHRVAAVAASDLADDRRLDAEIAGLEADLRRLDAERASTLAEERREEAESAQRSAERAQSLADQRRARAVKAEGDARDALKRSRRQADMARRMFDVLLFDARTRARKTKNERLRALLRRLEPSRSAEADLSEPGLATQRRRFTDALLGLAQAGGNPGQAVVALRHAAELAPGPATRVEALSRLALAQRALRDDISAVRTLDRAAATAKSAKLSLPASFRRAKAELEPVREKVAFELDKAQAQSKLNNARTPEEIQDAVLFALKRKRLRALIKKRMRRERKNLEAMNPTDLTKKQRALLAALQGNENAVLDMVVAQLSGKRSRPTSTARTVQVDPRSLTAWLKGRISELRRERRLTEILGIRHYRLKSERKAAVLIRVELRLEPTEPPTLVLDVEQRALEGRERRTRVVHRYGLDLRHHHAVMFYEGKEASGRVQGPSFLFRGSHSKRSQKKPWGPDSAFQTLVMFVLPRLLPLGAPTAALRCSLLLDVWGGFDDRAPGLTFRRAGGKWELRTSRDVFYTLEQSPRRTRWSRTHRMRRTLTLLTPAEAIAARAAADPLPEGEAALEAKAKTGHAWAMYAWGLRVEQRAHATDQPVTLQEMERARRAAMTWLVRAAEAGHVQAAFEAAQRLLGAGETARGVALLEPLAKSGDTRAMVELARANRRDPQSAERWYRSALKAGNRHALGPLAEHLVKKARRCLATKRPAAALAAVNEAIELDSRRGDARLLRAELRLALLDGEGAVTDVTFAFGSWMEQVERSRKIYSRMGRTLPASSIRRDPRLRRLLRLRVQAYALAGRWAEAQKDHDNLAKLRAPGALDARAEFMSRTRSR